MNLRRFFFIIGMLTTSICYAQENTENQVEEATAIEMVLQNAQSCVKAYDQDRVYLNEEKIYPTKEGVFVILNENGDYVQIPTLHSDKFGCFLEIANRSRSSEFDSKVTKPCPFCGWDRVTYALKCRNPDCSSNKPK